MGLREKELNIEIPKVQNIVIKVHKEQELGLPTYFWVQDTGYLHSTVLYLGESLVNTSIFNSVSLPELIQC